MKPRLAGSAPAPAMEITIEERDALYGQALNHLSGLGDLWIAIKDEDFETAEQLGRQFGDELRLIDDLGWGDAPAAAIELRMPPEELHRVFTNLRADAEALRRDEVRDEAEAEEEAREFRNRAKRVTEVCDRVLSVVGRTPPAEAVGRDA